MCCIILFYLRLPKPPPDVERLGALLREPPPKLPPELLPLPNEPRLLPNELPELRLLPIDGLLLILGILGEET